MSDFRQRTHEILEAAPEGDRVSRALDFCIVGLILLNTVALVLDTVDPIHDAAGRWFYYLEITSVSIFLVEYLVRIWACTAEEQYAHPVKGRLKFALTPLLLIDLIAILPFFMPLVGIEDLRFLRAVRLLARAARLGRYFSGIRTLGDVIKRKGNELATVVMILAIMLVLASALIYFAEHRQQPEDFASIPHAMWWSVITLTTVGYGDVSPVTPIGKVMAGVIAIMGIGMFALPAGIISSGLMDRLGREEEPPAVCPHCGESLAADTNNGNEGDGQ